MNHCTVIPTKICCFTLRRVKRGEIEFYALALKKYPDHTIFFLQNL